MDESPKTLAEALDIARLRAIRTNLLPLHRSLIDLERARYERVNGPLDNPHQVLQLAMSAPSFQWLRPVTTLIVQIDERLAGDLAVSASDVATFATEVRGLLQGDLAGAAFREGYQRALQEDPVVVMAHAQVMKLLSEIAR